MAELEQGLEELKIVKQAFKDNISANDIPTYNVEFRNMPNLLKQMEKKLPTQTKEVAPSTSPQTITPDSGYKLSQVNIKAVIPSDYYKPEQVLSVSPKITSQTITPSANYVYNKVNINAVTSTIDSNIIPTNIRKGTSILGVQGNLEADKPDQQKTINPTTSRQDVVADTGYELAKVTINAVTSSIDNNIQSTNIKKGVSILGVTGTLEGTVAPKLQEKNINPTTNSQSVVADNGYDGLSKVNVSAVTSEIDGNIKPENIKKDVSILGVIGNLVQTSGDAKFGQLVDGTITAVEEGDLASVTSIRDGVFNGLSINLASIPSNVSSIGTNAFSNNKISNLTISDGVTTIGASAFENNQISTLTIPQSVTTIGASAFAGNELLELTMESDTPPVVTETSFPSSLTTTNVSYNGYENYATDENWQPYKDTLVRGLAIPSTISVTVNNYLGGVVSGAIVTITGNGQTFTGTTNASGVFVQGDLQPATYTISVADVEGFKTPNTQEVVVLEDSNNVINFTYLEKPATLPFEQSTPMEISEISAEISAKNMTSSEIEAAYGWKLGDTKDITLTTGEVIQMQIIGFNHDDKSDGTGKAGITLQMKDCLKTKYPLMNTRNNAGGYGNSYIKGVFNNTIKPSIPSDWSSIIVPVIKKYANGGFSNYSDTLSLNAELFLISAIEIMGNTTDAMEGTQAGLTEGYQYEFWSNKTNEDRIKKYDSNGDGVPNKVSDWWLRSCNSSSVNHMKRINESGGISQFYSDERLGISFAFCV